MSEREIQGIPEWVSQVILFLFGGWLFSLGSDLISSNQPWLTASIFGLGVLLIGMAGVGPSRIANFGAKWGKGGGGFGVSVRNKPTEKDRDLVFKFAQDKPSPEIEKEGEKFIEKAEERTPEQRSPEDYLALATEKWRAKDYDSALADVFAGLALNPEDVRLKATLIHRKGSIYESLGLLDKGIKYYKDAMELDPSFTWPYNGLGWVYYQQGMLEIAEVEFKKAIDLDPKYADAHNNLGIVYNGQGKLTEAEEEYKKAIALHSEFPWPHTNLGILYQDQGKLAEAREECQKAIELDPNDSYGYNNLGVVYQKQGMLIEAEEEYQKAIELDPKNASSRNNLGALYQSQDKLEQAKREYEEALRLKPDYTKAIENLENIKREMEEGK